MGLHIPSISVALERLFHVYTKSEEKPTVLVIGSGWGSNAFVSAVDRNKYNVEIISTSKSRLNQPRMIPDFKPSYKELPIEPTIDKCISIRPEPKIVLGMKGVYYYDYLVLATGSEPNHFGTKGVKTHCLMFKTDDDLKKLQTHLTTHNPLNVTVIGAGPTGIELAFKLRSMNYNVTILEASNIILPGFSDKMREQINQLLIERNITVKLNTKITEVTETTIKTPEGHSDRDKILIWTCGVKPTSFVRDLTPMGRQLTTDGSLMFAPNIYVLGDIVANRGPPTAQNAKQQGIYLAKHFNNNFNSANDYTYQEKGRVLDVADSLIIERSGHVIKLPSFLRAAFYYFVD